ncbi:mechanosensitive ion channel family protein [Methanobacterium oryzae]|uniref:mechanosensitive ion channel family protein n=1 Tax=Methanobacterium oryzae TaxID=69540 RepID=UPI003D22FFA7
MVDYTVVILQPITNTLNQVLTYIPVIIAALIILLIGWIIGRIAGGVASRLFKTMRVDETIGKTGIGDALAGTGMSATGLFSAVVRWFIYLIFIMAAVSVLNIPVFTNFVNQVVLYIPNLIAGILILVVGLVGINFIMDWIKAMLQKQKVEFANIITMGLQALLSLVVIVIALDQLQIDTQIIYTFLVPLAWGLAAGLAIAIGLAVGVGGKDVAAEYLGKMAKTGESRAGEVKEKAAEAERKAGGGDGGEGEEFREPGTGMGGVEGRVRGEMEREEREGKEGEPKGKFKRI